MQIQAGPAEDAPVFSAIEPVPHEAAWQYLKAVSERDICALNYLVNFEYPLVVWGSLFQKLDPEDKDWVTRNLD